MAAAKHNLIISRGADFGFRLTIRNSAQQLVDVSNDTFKAEIRRAPKQPLLAAFTCDALTDGENGVVNFALPSSESLKLDGKITCYWDVYRMTPLKDKLIAGTVTVEDNLTHI
jgi:hypothetical protein